MTAIDSLAGSGLDSLGSVRPDTVANGLDESGVVVDDDEEGSGVLTLGGG